MPYVVIRCRQARLRNTGSSDYLLDVAIPGLWVRRFCSGAKSRCPDNQCMRCTRAVAPPSLPWSISRPRRQHQKLRLSMTEGFSNVSAALLLLSLPLFLYSPSRSKCSASIALTSAALTMASGKRPTTPCMVGQNRQIATRRVEQSVNAVGVPSHPSHILCTENFDRGSQIGDSSGEASVHKCAKEVGTVNTTMPRSYTNYIQ